MPSENELSRREREQLNHRQQIVDVAMRLFSVRGFHTVSMQEVATEAEFAIGTLYKFFPSKEALYYEIMDQACGRIGEVFDPILNSNADEREKVSRMIRSSLEIIPANAPAIRLFLQAHQQRALVCTSTAPTEKAGRFHETMLANFEKVIAEGVRKGVFRAIDPKVGALALDATLRALAFAEVQNPQPELLEGRIADFERLLFNGILNPKEDSHV
jgi:AcrR family transcriptional regulator